MKKIGFDNLRAATTAGPSETETLFSNEFKFPNKVMSYVQWQKGICS